MQQRCVIIERLTSCPPISHLGCPGHLFPLQLNAPRKWDKIVINAKSLCLLSCSEKGQCYWPHACSKWVNKKEKMDTRIEQKPVVAVGSIISLSFHSFWMCVSQNRSCNSYCKLSPLSAFGSLVPMFSVLIPWASNIKQVQMEKFKEKTISQSQWHDSLSDRVVMPHSHPHPLLCVYSVVL